MLRVWEAVAGFERAGPDLNEGKGLPETCGAEVADVDADNLGLLGVSGFLVSCPFAPPRTGAGEAGASLLGPPFPRELVLMALLGVDRGLGD